MLAGSAKKQIGLKKKDTKTKLNLQESFRRNANKQKRRGDWESLGETSDSNAGLTAYEGKREGSLGRNILD